MLKVGGGNIEQSNQGLNGNGLGKTESSFVQDSMYNMLAEKTHTEIFRTNKDAVKKQINYMNYSQ